MKKLLLISFTSLALLAPAVGHAGAKPIVPLLAGTEEANVIHIWLEPDGRSYVLDSTASLEVAISACRNPEGKPSELVCRASRIAGFEVNAGDGDDIVTVAESVPVPVTLRGDSGDDLLIGGAENDLLEGDDGNDRISGRGGDDDLRGAAGTDAIFGGGGGDLLIGGPGEDELHGGPGRDALFQEKRTAGPQAPLSRFSAGPDS
jgi:hypothetical protein